MAVIWGEAEVVLHTDGRALPGEVRAATTAAATEGGQAFQKVFRREMRKAATGAVGEFASTFTSALNRAFRNTRVFDVLSRRLRMIRTDFRILGNYVRGQFGDAMTGLRNGVQNVIRPFREFAQEVGERSRAATDELREGMTHLRISTKDLSDTFPGLSRAIDRVRESTEPLRSAVGRLRDRFALMRQSMADNRTGILDFRAAMENLRIDIGDTTENIDDNDRSHGRLGRSLNKGVGHIRKFLSAWKGLPHGFRQAVFWTGLVVAAMGSLSVLGSALTGTILALSAALIGLGAGAGIAVAGFIGLFEEGAKLEAGARASLEAFQALGDAFQNLQTGITNTMFAGMAESISNITNVLLPALEGSILAFAGQVGASLGSVFDALSSPLAVENFKALLEGFIPIFDSLVQAAIGFGSGLGGILVAALPTAQKFADAIRDVGQRFGEWANSEAGRTRLAEFFATAERIMPMVVDLFVAAGQALANLVTPTTIASFETFLTSLTNFMPVLGEILEVVANVNVFGVLAAALEAIGAILTPLMPVLQEFAAIFGATLIAGIQSLIPAFTELGVALAPILDVLGTLIIAILPPLITIVQSVIEYITLFAEALIGADTDSKEFKESIQVMGEVVRVVFEIIANVVSVTLTIIGGLLKSTSQLLKGDFSGAFKTMEGVVRGVFKTLGLDFDEFVNFVEDMVREVSNFFRDMGKAIGRFGDTVADIFSGVIGWIQDAVNWFGSLFGAAKNASSAASGARGSGGGNFASGGILNGPRRILAGEAGPEAIIPLNRALSQVDPSVRWLSAIAQGKDPGMASGGVVGGGRTVNIEAGAVVVQGQVDPQRTALAVVNRLAERIAG